MTKHLTLMQAVHGPDEERKFTRDEYQMLRAFARMPVSGSWGHELFLYQWAEFSRLDFTNRGLFKNIGLKKVETLDRLLREYGFQLKPISTRNVDFEKALVLLKESLKFSKSSKFTREATYLLSRYEVGDA